MIENPAIFIPAAKFRRSEVIHDLGPDNELYIRRWNEIKAAL